MRHPDDKIWGYWGPDEISPQIWELSRDLLDQYGFALDIVLMIQISQSKTSTKKSIIGITQDKTDS